VPGLRVVDVGSEPRLGRLCTADVQAQLGQDVWDALIRDEIARAHAGGAETLATIYHGCQRLMWRLRGGRPDRDRALSLGVRARLGIEFEDRYKTFRLWQDPSVSWRSPLRARPRINVDPARARQLVEKTFGASP